MDIKSLIAEVVLAVMDMREVSKRAEKPTRLKRPKIREMLTGIFRPVIGDTHAPFN